MSAPFVVEIVQTPPPVLEIVKSTVGVVEVSAPRGVMGPTGPQGLDGFIVADVEDPLWAVGTVWVKPV